MSARIHDGDVGTRRETDITRNRGDGQRTTKVREMPAISKRDAEEDIVPNNRLPVTFRAVALFPGDNTRRIGTIETTEDMTPQIAMTVIGDYIRYNGIRSNNSFIVIYNSEDEGIAYSQVRGIAASIIFEGGEVMIEFFDLPVPHGKARHDA